MMWAHREAQSLVQSDTRRDDFNNVGLTYLRVYCLDYVYIAY